MDNIANFPNIKNTLNIISIIITNKIKNIDILIVFLFSGWHVTYDEALTVLTDSGYLFRFGLVRVAAP